MLDRAYILERQFWRFDGSPSKWSTQYEGRLPLDNGFQRSRRAIAAADASRAGTGARYGYFEVLMKMPPGPVTWPALGWRRGNRCLGMPSSRHPTRPRTIPPSRTFMPSAWMCRCKRSPCFKWQAGLEPTASIVVAADAELSVVSSSQLAFSCYPGIAWPPASDRQFPCDMAGQGWPSAPS